MRYLAVFAGTAAFAFLGLLPVFWLALYGLSAALLLLRFGPTLQTIARNLPLILFPLVCWMSFLWSVAPSATIAYSGMLTFTYLIALQVGMSTPPRVLIRSATLVLVFVAATSALNITGIFSDPWDHRDNLKGVLTSKNGLGHTMVLLILFSLFEALRKRERQVFARAGWLMVAALAFVLILLADSAASLALGAALGVAFAGTVLFLRNGLKPLIALACLFGIGSVVLVALVLIQSSPSELLFNALSRDSTMTGRTIIWDIGWNAYSERPVLGYGANGFWNWGRMANLVEVLQSQYGEHLHGFHNLTIELLIMAGPAGLAAFLVGFLLCVARAVALLWRDIELGLLVIAVLTFLFFIALVDVALYKEHALLTMLPVALCVSIGRHRSVHGDSN
jgi:exopolysaccharide production protein ExoQ